jgi:hypothetical protein
VDQPGVGIRVAKMAIRYGLDHLNALFLTPLPGTRLWDQMAKDGRLDRDEFPKDWKYYTLTLPVAQYRNFSLDEISEEMLACNRHFFSTTRILRRFWGNLLHRRAPIIGLVASLSCRSAIPQERDAYARFIRSRRPRRATTAAYAQPEAFREHNESVSVDSRKRATCGHPVAGRA